MLRARTREVDQFGEGGTGMRSSALSGHAPML